MFRFCQIIVISPEVSPLKNTALTNFETQSLKPKKGSSTNDVTALWQTFKDFETTKASLKSNKKA